MTAVSTTKSIPKQARAVIIGGGIAGCSIAYHLTKLGWKDIVLVERAQLTSGTTWHAAGLLTTLRDTEVQTNLAAYSQKLYRELEAETGQATGLITCGSIQLALTPEKVEEMRRGLRSAQSWGIDCETGMRLFFCGPESFTPDHSYLMGEAPNLKGFFIAAGFNSLGILSGGGAGLVMAHWIVHGHAPMDVWTVNIRRTLGTAGHRAARRQRQAPAPDHARG